MKTRKTIFNYLLFAVLMVVFQACLKKEYEDIQIEGTEPELQQSNYEGFDFKTVEEYDVTINALNNKTQPIDGVYVELYINNPLDSNGTLKPGIRNKKIFQGITNNSGVLKCKINPPASADSLFVLSYYIGLPPLYSKALVNNSIVVNMEGSTVQEPFQLKSATVVVPTIVNGFYTLGGWNSYGVPDYLESENDIISNDLLDDINASLPERDPLPQSHPQYLANNNDANLILLEDCEAWVTFVHEGAGWHNTLGYYTYQTNNPPTSIDDINDRTIIFPDVSAYLNGLAIGNKVQLFYLDTTINEYSAIFPAGISIGWFLIAQGWSSASQSVTNGVYTHYSNVGLNVETDNDLKKHNVLLYDDVREILLLGFEDIRRDDPGCDQDFNDAVFYTTVSPITAVDNSIYQSIDNPVDTDGDGTSDLFDEYPNDPDKAFNNYYPSKGETGTLVFEDLWPYKGDYDFNDLVIDYNFNQITNSQNEVTSIYSSIVVRAIGASYHNAFGISFSTAPGNISSVTGQRNTKEYLNIASNGTENGQSEAVIIFFDDAYNALPYPGTGVCVNTYPEDPYVKPDTLHVNIEFTNPVLFSEIGTPPYNPFIIIGRNRGMEVHLPNLPPTDLADLDSLGIGDDDSDLNANKYYVSDIYLPWAINLPESFDYPAEKQDITKTHLVFDNWATSLGYNYMDWYKNNLNYRDYSRIYTK